MNLTQTFAGRKPTWILRKRQAGNGEFSLLWLNLKKQMLKVESKDRV